MGLWTALMQCLAV